MVVRLLWVGGGRSGASVLSALSGWVEVDAGALETVEVNWGEDEDGPATGGRVCCR